MYAEKRFPNPLNPPPQNKTQKNARTMDRLGELFLLKFTLEGEGGASWVLAYRLEK